MIEFAFAKNVKIVFLQMYLQNFTKVLACYMMDIGDENDN